MNIQFTTRELRNLIISALVLGVVFGFDDGREVFNAQAWLSNFFLVVVLSLGSLGLFILAQKWSAARRGAHCDVEVWSIKRVGFAPGAHMSSKGFGIPLGIILPILVIALSNGSVWFAATGIAVLSSARTARVGRQFVNLREFDCAKIALAGPLISIIIALMLSLVQQPDVAIFSLLIKMNIAIAVSNMLPFPLLAGGQAFFGSFFLYVFTAAFIGLVSVLMLAIPTFATLVFASALALIGVTIVFYFLEVK